MIIGFLGKGGSGKSTLAYRFAQYMHELGNEVLAIDADHNMDLSYNLKADGDIPYIGRSMDHMRQIVGLDPEEDYANIFLNEKKPVVFSINPPDVYTEKWSVEIAPGMRLMTAGPHTDGILHGGGCSHTLYTPLKVYLPLLCLRENQYVVIDEKAGTDSVGTGITTGFDVAFICVEPTHHSIKAAKQIASLLVFFGTPYVFAWNKVRNEKDRELLAENMPKNTFFFASKEYLSNPEENTRREEKDELGRMLEHVRKLFGNHSKRFERTKIKFERNYTYEER